MSRFTSANAPAVVLLAAAAVSAQFTPIVTDFASGVQPFTGASRDTANYVSGPSSMRVAHQYAAKAATTEGAYAGTVVQANFWVGPGFPAAPVRFQCMLRDLTLGAVGHEMDIHLNFGTTDYGYSWLGMHYFCQGAYSGDWQVGMDETIDDIGSLRNPWNGQPTFREKYDQLYGSRTQKPAVVLTLVIETMKGAICVDDLSVTTVATAVRAAPALSVRQSLPAGHGTWRVVTPDGRLLRASDEHGAFGSAVRFAQGCSRGAVSVR